MKSPTHRIAVCACDGCPEMGQSPARRRLGPMPADVDLVHLSCPRAFEPSHILQLLVGGADGVLIVGCGEGAGRGGVSNWEVGGRLQVLRCMLQQAGLAPDRVAVEWVPMHRWGHTDAAVDALRAALGLGRAA